LMNVCSVCDMCVLCVYILILYMSVLTATNTGNWQGGGIVLSIMAGGWYSYQ
jgi:hypothetical protein